MIIVIAAAATTTTTTIPLLATQLVFQRLFLLR
jgi:hypothetical protein